MPTFDPIHRRTVCSLAAALAVLVSSTAFAQAPDVNQLPAYKPEFKVQGSLRIAGSELKGNIDLLVEGFKKFHPDAVVSTSATTPPGASTVRSSSRLRRTSGTACRTSRPQIRS